MTAISIVGAHGTGKTTLCHLINNIYADNNPFIIPDVARFCPFEIGLYSNVKSQSWILERQIEIESIFSRNSEHLTIFDNCGIGHLAYFKYFDGRNLELEQSVIKLAKKKDGIFLLPLNYNFLVNDGIRTVNKNFYKEIQLIINDLLESHNINFVRIPENWHNLNKDNLKEILKLSKMLPNSYECKTSKIVSVAIVENNRNEILTTKRSARKIVEADNRWELPGGGVEFDEDPRHTVEREVFEETGYIVKAQKPLPVIQSNSWTTIENDKIHTIVLCYVCTLLDETQFNTGGDKDVTAIAWKRINELRKLPLIKGIDNFLNEYSFTKKLV